MSALPPPAATVVAAAAAAATAAAARSPFIDIGANLLDTMFQGVYHGKAKHEGDLHLVLERAWSAGLASIIITAGTFEESEAALTMAASHSALYCTVGCHPTRSKAMVEDPQSYCETLKGVIQANQDKVLAVGECGLDYDRLEFADQDTQRKAFRAQLGLAVEVGLPLFLHNRNTGGDFHSIMAEYAQVIKGGVVHSFTGGKEELDSLLELGLYIGINGCSLKTADNVEVVRSLPLSRLMLETDAPWCGIRPTHAAFHHVKTTFPTVSDPKKFKAGSCVKDRSEPCHIIQVAEAVAGIKGVTVEEVAEAAFNNTRVLFFGGPRTDCSPQG